MKALEFDSMEKETITGFRLEIYDEEGTPIVSVPLEFEKADLSWRSKPVEHRVSRSGEAYAAALVNEETGGRMELDVEEVVDNFLVRDRSDD